MIDKIIDAHCHAFPDKIALKAGQAIGAFYGIEIREDGSYQTMLERGSACGVVSSAVLAVATAPSQVRRANEFLAENMARLGSRIVGFAASHPDDECRVDEVALCRASGFRGVKVHPDIQGFKLDDPRMFEVYEAMGDDMLLYAHTGDHRYDNSSPARVKHVLRLFPKLRVICAHLGGWRVWDEACSVLTSENVYVDTSSTTDWHTDEQLAKIIRAYGSSRVLFGTDYPMWRIGDEARRISSLPLPSSDIKAIMFDNASELFGLGDVRRALPS